MKIEKVTEKREIVTVVDEDVYVLKLSKEELQYIWYWAANPRSGFGASSRLGKLVPQEVKDLCYTPDKCFLP